MWNCKVYKVYIFLKKYTHVWSTVHNTKDFVEYRTRQIWNFILDKGRTKYFSSVANIFVTVADGNISRDALSLKLIFDKEQHVEAGHGPERDQGVLPLGAGPGVQGLLLQPDEDQLPQPGVRPGVLQRRLQRDLPLQAHC